MVGYEMSWSTKNLKKFPKSSCLSMGFHKFIYWTLSCDIFHLSLLSIFLSLSSPSSRPCEECAAGECMSGFKQGCGSARVRPSQCTREPPETEWRGQAKRRRAVQQFWQPRWICVHIWMFFLFLSYSIWPCSNRNHLLLLYYVSVSI
jgi:hypothetical protein